MSEDAECSEAYNNPSCPYVTKISQQQLVAASNVYLEPMYLQ